MTLRIFTYDGQAILCECDSFEFRTNHVSNWIKFKKGTTTNIIHNVATIKTEEESEVKDGNDD